MTHPSAGMPSLSLDKQENEVTENHAYIKENFGYDMYLFRYPTGRFSEQSLALLNNCNYKSIFWSFAYLDYDVNNQPDHASSLQKMKDKLHPVQFICSMRSQRQMQQCWEILLMP